MATLDWRSRARAALWHLLISGGVAIVAAALVFLVWYPVPFATLAGGQGLFMILVSVDVVIGPLITLAIFDRSKSRAELRRDLAVVALLQLAALGYGLHTMYIARPVALALEGDRFRVVTAADVLLRELPSAQPGLQTLPLWGPRLLNTAPVEPADKFDAVQLALNGHDIGTRPKYWRSWDASAREDVKRGARPLAQLRAKGKAQAQDVDQAVAGIGVPAEHVKFIPIISLHAQSVALVDMRSGDIAGYAPVDGF
jgi:hypothetical protein